MARENPQAENLLIMAGHAEVEHAKLSQARATYRKWLELIKRQTIVANEAVAGEMRRQLAVIDPDHEAIRMGDLAIIRRALRSLGLSTPLPIWTAEIDKSGKIRVWCDDDRSITKNQTLDMREEAR